jgi:ribonucleotide monophosphatase NagD (HAD superfamily)
MVEKLVSLYDVYILDFDGTLFKGNGQIPGVSNCVFELIKLNKLVLFYTNGGWCTVQFNYD